MPLTAAERRARIRQRLKEAEEPAGTVEETTNTFTEEQSEPEPEPASPIQRTSVSVPRPPRVVTQPRPRGKPPNYKLHVLTALALSVGIRIARYGTKALTG